jgi:hypothetical protein
LSQEIARLVLPFAVSAPDRNEAFSVEAEKAALFCLAELERGKGGGIVAKQPPEKITFIAKVAYPLWLFPFDKVDLLFDGLNETSHTLSHSTIQDIRAFIDGMGRSSSSRETYMAFLSDNANYFRPSDKQTVMVTEGLMADPGFLEDFSSYFSEAKTFDTLPSEMVALPPTLDEASVIAGIHELEELKAKLVEEVKNLDRSMKLLNATTKGFTKTIQAEIKEVKDKFNVELEKHRGPVEEEVGEIRLKGDEEIIVVSRRSEKELLHLQREKTKREKTRDQLTGKIARCEAEMKSHAGKKDKAGERRWKEERGKHKKERSQVDSEIKKLERDLKEAEEKKGEELFRLRSEVDAKTQEATKELVEIESSRDAKVQMLTQEMEKMETQTAIINKQIDQSIRQREASIEAFEKLGLSYGNSGQSLVYMPFYLVGFQSESRRRYVHYPPSCVNNVKLLVKLKGALGMAKVKQLLRPRSEATASFLNRFPSMLEEKTVFEREMGEAAAKADILRARNAKESIGRGLDQLKEEGWLSEKEYETFSRHLA